ncbi:uncharacterized protein LOC131284940 [Anopheles ziemanni]|uniref:uncharacterized protein LOC131262479 n=1 Tax=Anopheles coustani TaxID=139045 RepID=UPI00265A8DB7|nr:uncharacterized protein LOC131262479 [Anopheles coustani]XP_058169781.1 uncharacterized protein LOC131284940 [Anopheles ziemanni]
MRHSPKRSLWSYDETLEMLNIMMDQESLKAMNGRPFRKEKAFRLIQEEMAQRGFQQKDAKQIEYRWKNLKKRYIDIQKNPDSGDTPSFQYYDEIDLLMNGRTEAGGTRVTKPSRSAGEITKERAVTSTSPKATTKPEPMDDSVVSPAKNDQHDTSIDESFCDDVAMEEEVVEEPAETSDASQRRSQRSTKGQNPRYNADNFRAAPSSSLSTPRVTEDEQYRSQKRLIDYQFGLYSRLQQESDEKFLQMSREMLIQCNVRFETFVSEVLAESDIG